MIKRMFFLLAMLVAVPGVGYTVAQMVQSHNDSQLQAILKQQYPNAPQERIRAVTVDTLCSASSPSAEDICTTNNNLNMMREASLCAALAGLAMLVFIKLAGIVSKSNRTLLLVVFRPGLYLTALVLVGLVLVHATIAIGIIYYGESALVDRVHVGIIAAIGIGAALGAFTIVRHTFAILHKAQTVVIGTELSREKAPRLWQTIDDTARRLGSLLPDHAVVGLEPNFFVTEADVVCLSGTMSGRTFYCSLPLARILSKDQFVSVLGHELGHFKGDDTKFSKRFYPIYRSTTSSLQALGQAGGEGAGGIALLPAIVVFSYFLESFSNAESRISRDRELAADLSGASIASKAAIATALVKLHAFSGIWNDLQQVTVEQLRNGLFFTNVSKLFADAAAEHAKPESLNGIIDTHLSHPTDSHPPLAARLQSLGVHLSDVSNDALIVTPTDSALSLFDNPEEYEQNISAQYQVFLAQQFGIEIPTGEVVGETTTVST
jgi:Zn-dependent protease with chaperone function